MKALRLVLDTNVVVAGLRSRRGASHLVLREVPRRTFTLLLSVPLFAEYEATLKRPDVRAAHGLADPEIDSLLAVWAQLGEAVVRHFAWRPQLADPNDEMVLETAVNGSARAIVTFNQADFSGAARRFGVDLWTPGQLLDRLRGRP